jgi:hypothetical protein
MYRRPKFLEILLEIRREMAHEADYDVELFAELARTGHPAANTNGLDGSIESSPVKEKECMPRRKRPQRPVNS